MSCCICDSVLATGKGVQKRKKLHGKSRDSEKLRRALMSCVELCGSTPEEIGLDNPACIVCYECTVRLGKIYKDQLNLVENQVEILKQLFGDENSLPVSDIGSSDQQQNSCGTSQATDQAEQNYPSTPQRCPTTPKCIRILEQTEADNGEPRRKRSTVTVSVSMCKAKVALQMNCH